MLRRQINNEIAQRRLRATDPRWLLAPSRSGCAPPGCCAPSRSGCARCLVDLLRVWPGRSRLPASCGSLQRVSESPSRLLDVAARAAWSTCCASGPGRATWRALAGWIWPRLARSGCPGRPGCLDSAAPILGALAGSTWLPETPWLALAGSFWQPEMPRLRFGCPDYSRALWLARRGCLRLSGLPWLARFGSPERPWLDVARPNLLDLAALNILARPAWPAWPALYANENPNA